MRSLEDLIQFLRGTRQPAPPGPREPLVTLFLVTASLAHLPLVYLFVARIGDMTAITLLVGLLAIGLAWCAGVSLEGRRAGTVRAIAAMGVAEGAIAFLPGVAEAIGSPRYLFVFIAALCLGALASRQLVRARSRAA